MSAVAAGPARDVYRLRAMEIWGGSEAACEHMVTSGFEAWLYARPHEGGARGGDLRFVSTCAAGQIVRFTLADIAGHGEEAGEEALRLRALIRKHINTPNPTMFARSLNREFARMAEAGRFATAVITTYFAPTDHLMVCNAGHPRPLLFRASERRWMLFDEMAEGVLPPERSKETGVSNLPLGLLEPTSYPQFATRLAPGDVLVVYTDALIEAAGADGRQVGEEGLLGIARGLDASRPEGLGTALLDAVASWRGGRPAEDDETVLVLLHTATDPPDGAWDRVKALARVVGLMK